MVQLGLKSRSHRVVQDSSVVIQKPNLVTGKVSGDEDERIGCYWNSLPPELLREILLKVDESGSKWPVRKSVVACAGVCRNWRKVMKEIVSTPELSGKLTFPISIKQPGPRDSLLQCFIKRNRSTQMYYLFASCSQALADDGKLLLSARRCKRPTCTDYMIHLHPNGTSKGGDSYIGKLRSNFLGRKFVVYDALPPYSGVKIPKSRSTRPDVYDESAPPKVPMGNYPVAHISYELNVLEARGPRRLQCVMDAIPDSSIRPGGVAPTQTHLPITGHTSPAFPFFRGGSIYFDKSPFRPSTHHTDNNKSLFLRNKPPRWHDQFQCWCLNFHGRVTVASVKNFQLVACPGDGEPGPEHEKVILQFGKVGKDVFTMDYRYPISAFQAFAICLSSFDTKIACE